MRTKHNTPALCRMCLLLTKTYIMYSLDCSYFEHKFNSIDELISYVCAHGIDPNYEITKDGVKTGEMACDLLTE